ncbi:MAG: hypothetical protein F6K31_38395 [Symploca sp. SIO2G7]|nr:hypothetical protein [Symploca sp. SIO2G7]
MSLQEQLVKAGWCYERHCPEHYARKSEVYQDWEIVTYPELALHYLPTGEYFISSTHPKSKLKETTLKIIKALIDSDK